MYIYIYRERGRVYYSNKTCEQNTFAVFRDPIRCGPMPRSFKKASSKNCSDEARDPFRCRPMNNLADHGDRKQLFE